PQGPGSENHRAGWQPRRERSSLSRSGRDRFRVHGRRCGRVTAFAARARGSCVMAKIPSFADVPFDAGARAFSLAEWRARVEQETGSAPEALSWQTPEQLPVKPLYSEEDLAPVDHLDSMPGMA